MNGLDYTYFSNRIYASGTDVQTKAVQAGGANDLLVSGDRLEGQDEPRRAIDNTHSIA